MTAARLCTFTVGDSLYGLEVHRVQEVLRPQEATRVPHAGANIRGLINIRGQIVMAIDLRRCLGLEPAPEGHRSMNLVLRTEDGPVSLLIDRALDVLDLDPSTYEPPPASLLGPRRELIRGTFPFAGRFIHLLDADAVLGLIDQQSTDERTRRASDG
ncbi:MAG TPA: chemotaxis protein CheW [Isosphaeraceae bacterium]